MPPTGCSASGSRPPTLPGSWPTSSPSPLRQAYRYLEQAATLAAPVPVAEPTVAITFKLPVSIVRALRTYARRSGLTLGQIVTRALAAFLGTFHRRRG